MLKGIVRVKRFERRNRRKTWQLLYEKTVRREGKVRRKKENMNRDTESGLNGEAYRGHRDPVMNVT